MSEHQVIEAVKTGEVKGLKNLLAGGADSNEQDEQGWTPLGWAAGRGDADAVELLLAHGADIALAGRDRRTPLMIAKAASRKAVAAILTAAEQQAGVWVDPRETRPYCRAYYLRDLRRFPSWSERRVNWQASPAGEAAAEVALTGDDIVYLHQDFVVTRSMWHEESVIFSERTPEWREFCGKELDFSMPEDLL